MKRTEFHCPACRSDFTAKYWPGRGAAPIPIMCPDCRVVLPVEIGPRGPVAIRPPTTKDTP